MLRFPTQRIYWTVPSFVKRVFFFFLEKTNCSFILQYAILSFIKYSLGKFVWKENKWKNIIKHGFS